MSGQVIDLLLLQVMLYVRADHRLVVVAGDAVCPGRS